MSRIENPPNREAAQLFETFAATAPRGSRRDVLRWGAMVTAAAVAARAGSAFASPASPAENAVANYQSADADTNVTLTVPFNPFGQAITLDPHQAPNWGPFWNLYPNVWGGLLRYDENGKVQLDLAESFAVSEDGKTYTFKIRSDAKYATGNSVVAGDFITSWKRALDPDALSPMAQFMQLVDGYDDYVSKASTDIGFKATDDQNIEITLSSAANYFPSYLAAFVWSVVDPKVLGDGSDTDFPLKDGGTGPWRFTKLDDSAITLEPNTNHYGGNSPSLAKLVFSLYQGQNADSDALNDYKADKVPLVDVPISLLDTVSRDPDLQPELVKITPSGSTRALAMDFKQAPFDDVRVRRALAFAIDRDKFANDIFEGTFLPTTSFSPPVLNTLSGYQPPAGLDFDSDQAKQSLEDAGFKGGDGLPDITYYEPAEDTDDEKARWATFFQGLSDDYGFPITVDTSKTSEQIAALQTDNGGRQLDVVWWWNVTETPHMLVDAFKSTSSAQAGVFNWSSDVKKSGDFAPGDDSKSFDGLVDKADVETDQDARNDLFKQAEDLVLKNAVAIPLGNWVQAYLQKSWLTGTKQGPWTGRLPIWFDKNVVVLKH